MTVKMSKKGNNDSKKKAFLEFKDECEKQIQRLGLRNWDIDIEHRMFEAENASDAAYTEIVETGKLANICLNKMYTPKDARRVAKHEVAHILLAKIQAIATNRFVNEAEIENELESLCTVLEKVL